MMPLPELNPDNAEFWTAGEHGELRISRCPECLTWLHPPTPVCRVCLSTDVRPETMPGEGEVLTYTVNRQPWLPGLEVPYALVVVGMDADPSIRLVGRISGVEVGAVRIGLRVRTEFARRGDVWVPVFVAVDEAGAA